MTATETMTKESILDEAKKITMTDRPEAYGPAKDNHELTAAMVKPYIEALYKHGRTLGPREICMINILQKISRDAYTPKRDNLVDIAGWAQNAEKVSE